MKILMGLRLYAGFETALLAGKPEFSGVPTIARLIEGLGRTHHSVRILFARRPGPLNWNERRDRSVSVTGISAEMVVLAGEEAIRFLPSRLRRYLSHARHVWRFVRELWRFRPDLVYFDRGHIAAAALVSRITRTPVVWRVMGVPESMREVLDWRGPRGWLWRWMLRSPFAAVICTLDGSGGGPWLERALRPSVERHVMMSGRDEGSGEGGELPVEIPGGRTIVVFVGRLESVKGIEEFLQAFALAVSEAPNELHAVVVGGGSLEGSMRECARSLGIDGAITFTGAIPHVAALRLLQFADIYVSLNRMGNLSNASLEALVAGVCMVIPVSDPATGVDLDTDALLLRGSALRFGAVGNAGALARAILHLHRHPDERRDRAAKARATAEQHLVSWDERIGREIAVLETIVVGSSFGRDHPEKRQPAKV